MARKAVAVSLLVFILFTQLYGSGVSDLAFKEGCKAFYAGDWESSVYLLKKAAAYSENDNPDTWYMLISSEVYAGDYNNALSDCDTFLHNFNNSMYTGQIQYIKGKLLYSLGEYENSILVLSDFCHTYENHDMYPSALFYIAESLYAEYRYTEAENLYKTIVVEFPDCEKTSASQFRIDSISQHSREEKLLYLLKQTGEEYLAAKEDYEKQLRMYNADNVSTARERLAEAQLKNQELELQISELEQQIKELKEKSARVDTEVTANVITAENSDALDDLKTLKLKAQQAQQLLNEKTR